MTWPSVSRHLAILSSAGLVRSTRHGQQLIYSLTTSVLADIVTELADMAGVNEPSSKSKRRVSNAGRVKREGAS
jgi:DNA-binding transcriptional ArsR family regulator